MKHDDNLKAGRLGRSAWILVPAVVAIVGTSGVVSKPAFQIEHLRSRRAQAEARVVALQAERQRAEELAGFAAGADVAGLHRRVESLVPDPISSLDTHALVALAARRSGWVLESIEIGDPAPAPYPVLGDRVLATRVDLRGVGSLEAIARTVESLQAAGLAVTVVEATLARSPTPGALFEARVTLSFHHRVPADVAVSAERRGDS